MREECHISPHFCDDILIESGWHYHAYGQNVAIDCFVYAPFHPSALCSVSNFPAESNLISFMETVTYTVCQTLS